jgi:hypothetical protein
MSVRKRLLGLGAGFVLVLAACGGTFGRGRNNPTYDGKVNFGPQMLHLDGGCVYVDGSLTSEDFFQNFERVDAGDHFEFRKDGKPITEYPGVVTTSIRVMGNQCGAPGPGDHAVLFGVNSYSLKFEVAWKDGLDMKPAALSSGGASCTGFNSITIPDRGYAIPTISCQLRVNADGVPLGDHLIVAIYSADGRQITRLSAAP